MNIKITHYRHWSMNTKLIALFVIFVITFIFFTVKGHASECVIGSPASDKATQAGFDGLAAAVSIVAAAEQAATGNFITGAALVTLASNEALKAYEAAKQSWELHQQGNENPCLNNSKDDHGPSDGFGRD